MAIRNLICFGEDWGGHPSTAQFLVQHLLETFRVIWINSIGWRPVRLDRADLARAVNKLRAAARGVQRPHTNLVVYSPLVIPWYQNPLVRRFNTHLLYCAVRNLARRHSFTRYSLMTTYPGPEGVFLRIKDVRRIYYCADEYTSFPGLSSELVRRLEKRLLGAVDVVVATSRELQHAKAASHPHVVLLPHGVDAAHFGKAADPSTPVPEDLAGLPRPIIGFCGLLADWVNLPLLRHIALARPDWSIVLVGKASADVEPLKGLANVHLLGQKSYSMLPGYYRGIDVALIPFVINDLTLRANPVKLREYLAAGLPVVSTPLPEALQFGELVRIGESPDAFVSRIEECLQEDPSLPGRRMASVRQDTWASRAAQLAAVL